VVVYGEIGGEWGWAWLANRRVERIALDTITRDFSDSAYFVSDAAGQTAAPRGALVLSEAQAHDVAEGRRHIECDPMSLSDVEGGSPQLRLARRARG
jgi:hypothetical protein